MILDAVFKLMLAGLVEISSVPLRASGAAAGRPKPKAGRLARLDAQLGSAWTTDPAHNMVPLDEVCSVLLPFLDGTHDRDALKANLLAAARDGRLRLDEATADAQVAAAIETLGRAALLE